MLTVIVGENHLKYVNILYFIIYSKVETAECKLFT